MYTFMVVELVNQRSEQMPMLTVEQARPLYKSADPVHDFNHVLRVLILARQLAREEDADPRIVETAALLHDVSRPEDYNLGMATDPDTDHAVLAGRYARQLLADEAPAFVDAVVHAIEAHRFRNAIEPRTIEARVLFDADKLDSIGAVGIARAFAYGGVLGQPLWGPVTENYTPDGHEPHTAHHEFHIKLKHIKDRLYTASGRRIAEQRHQFMTEFFARMAAEVRGER